MRTELRGMGEAMVAMLDAGLTPAEIGAEVEAAAELMQLARARSTPGGRSGPAGGPDGRTPATNGRRKKRRRKGSTNGRRRKGPGRNPSTRSTGSGSTTRKARSGQGRRKASRKASTNGRPRKAPARPKPAPAVGPKPDVDAVPARQTNATAQQVDEFARGLAEKPRREESLTRQGRAPTIPPDVQDVMQDWFRNRAEREPGATVAELVEEFAEVISDGKGITASPAVVTATFKRVAGCSVAKFVRHVRAEAEEA